MFEKLLSQLPYNPGLAHQMSFYSRRMREEASIRRIGVFFIVLAFFVQFFAVLSPPQSSVAASSNDLINGGINSAADAAQNCNNNIQHYKNILDNYGITCQQVAGAGTVNINSDGQNFYSFGRNAQGFNSEQPVNIPNLGTIYVRKLSAWGHNVTYRALQLSASTGKTFWILYQCGNLVSIDVPTPVNQNAGVGNNQPVTTPQAGIGGNQPVSTPRPAPTTPTTPTPTPPSTPSTPIKPPENCESLLSSTNHNACLAISKTAANTTQHLPDANNTTAQGGDVIVYTLYVKNTAHKATVKGYVFQENLSDVLDYADVADLHGGTLAQDGTATWPAENIKAGETATVQITVKVKDPVPQTPVSASDPTRFDLIMTNVYGNTISINLPGSVGKSVETAGATLPNTGPGTNLFIGAVIVIMAGYFYSRSRLLAKESHLALQEGTSL
jgi:hypothetical protein